MDDLRDRALGDVQLRTNDGPTYEGHTFVGGTSFERSERAIPVKPGVRCYTNANSVQRVLGLVSPTASLKMTSPQLDEHQLLQRDINVVCTGR